MKERDNTGCQISRLLKDMQHKPVQEDEEFSCVIPGNAVGIHTCGLMIIREAWFPSAYLKTLDATARTDAIAPSFFVPNSCKIG